IWEGGNDRRAESVRFGFGQYFVVAFFYPGENAVRRRPAVEKFGDEFDPFSTGQRMRVPGGEFEYQRTAQTRFQRRYVFRAPGREKDGVGGQSQQFFPVE